MKQKRYFKTIKFQFNSIQEQISTASNVVRWYPHLAFEWMESAQVRITSEVQAKFWNKHAKQMNDTVANIESMRYCDVGLFWGVYEYVKEKKEKVLVMKGNPRRLELIDETIISPNDWMKYV